MDTDEPRFGGQGRIAPGTLHEPVDAMDEARGEIVQKIRLYLPARTAVVLRRTRPRAEAAVFRERR